MPAGAKGSGSGQAVVQDPVRYLLGEDPFPKLNAYKRYVDKYLQGPEDYELRHLKFVRDTILDLPFYRLKTKITDLDKGAVIFIPKRSADEMVSEVHEGTIVYQDLHIYKSILDPSLKADLPVCILYFAEYTGQGRTANGTVLLNFSKVSHPIELPRGFRGVHIENYERFSVWLKAMDCGFISESEELDDRYRSLQLIHILFTVPTMNSVKE